VTIAGIIFDLDGVLVTTDELHYQAWQRIAAEEGIGFDRTINHRLRGVGRMESLDVILEKSPRAYAPAEKQALAQRKNYYYRRSLASLTPADVLPGALGLLRALRQAGVGVAVASASRNAPLILERTALRGQIDVLVDGGDVTRSKPDPQGFLLAAERLGLEPARCLVVEDAAAGVEAARRAGMAVLAIGTPDRFPDVPRVVAGLDGLSVQDLIGTE
jgi:beta-phosphoglucomutase